MIHVIPSSISLHFPPADRDKPSETGRNRILKSNSFPASFITTKRHLQLFNSDPINNNLSLEIITALDINYDDMVCEMSQKRRKTSFPR